MTITTPDRRNFWDQTPKQAIDGRHNIIPESELGRERESWREVVKLWHGGASRSIPEAVTNHRYYHHLRQIIMDAFGEKDYEIGETTLWYQLKIFDIMAARGGELISEWEENELINIIASRNAERMRM